MAQSLLRFKENSARCSSRDWSKKQACNREYKQDWINIPE
jgi:hypothetical protein